MNHLFFIWKRKDETSSNLGSGRLLPRGGVGNFGLRSGQKLQPPPLDTHGKVWPPSHAPQKVQPPLSHASIHLVAASMNLQPADRKIIGRKSIRRNIYNIEGGSVGSHPEEILEIGIKKVSFEQEKTATPPLAIWKKNFNPPSFSEKKNFNPTHPNFPTPSPLPVINDHSLTSVRGREVLNWKRPGG